MKPKGRVAVTARSIVYGLLVVMLAFQLSGCDDFNEELSADKTHWYVSTTGDDDNPCHTAKHPCRNIATALSRAAAGDTIHIADGTYYEQLNLTKAVKIYGASMANTIIDAQASGRPLTLDGTDEPNGFNLDLKDVTLTGGAVSLGGGFYLERGFYITLTNVEIRNNSASSAGGGIFSVNTALMILDNVSIHDNICSGGGQLPSLGGGIFFGTGEGEGGYFPAFFELRVWNSHLYNNSAENGGGIYNQAVVNIYNSTIESNSAGNIGGGIYSEYETDIIRTIIRKNTANAGGGIGNMDSGNPARYLILSYSTVSENTAFSAAGILNQTNLSLFFSTVSGNIATGGAGGGIMNSTTPEKQATYGTYAINSTISGNSATEGGGIWNGYQNGTSGFYYPGNFEGVNLTIANNIGGGIYFHYGSLDLTNVLLSNNGAANCDIGAAVSVVTSLSGDDSCPGFFEADPMIMSLADNGGYTLTHALLPGSPARDTGTQIPGGLYTDQREETRPLDGDGDGTAAIDIGAFEAEYQTFPYMTINPITTETPGLEPVGIYFTPDANPPCREGPAIFYRNLGVAAKGMPYLVTGRNQNSDWLQIELSESVRCWVAAGGGETGDTADVPVIPFSIITVTPTTVPVVCGDYFASDTCSVHPECTWKTVRDASGIPVSSSCVRK